MPATKPFYAPSVEKTKGGKINWTGKLTANLGQIDKPLRTKKPTVFFLSSMSDVFHKDMTFEMIDDLYDIMSRCPQHTFKVLTKRAERMYEYYKWKAGHFEGLDVIWPLPNVQIGVSVENQKYAEERLPFLLQCPAAIRFISAEPLLGPLNLGLLGTAPRDWNYGYVPIHSLLHQVIAGGESGPGARPMHPDWVRSIRDQCKEAGVAFWFKQWGEYIQAPKGQMFDITSGKFNDLNYRVFEDDTIAVRVGTKAAGHLLDGEEYFEQPNLLNEKAAQ